MWQVVRHVRSAIGGRQRPVEEAVQPPSGVAVEVVGRNGLPR